MTSSVRPKVQLGLPDVRTSAHFVKTSWWRACARVRVGDGGGGGGVNVVVGGRGCSDRAW
jgi:hypothetical protein